MEAFKMLDLSQKNKLVVKSNSLVEGRFYEKNPLIQGKLSSALTAREMDLLTVLFSAIDKDSKELRRVRVNIKDLADIFGLTGGSAYQHISLISKKLLYRIITIDDKENKILSQFQILSSAKYFHGKGYAEFAFNEELKPFLLGLKSHYSRYTLNNFISLKSFNSKRIYELLNQYSSTNKNNDGEWKRSILIDDLKEFVGIVDEKYKMYAHFKSRVLTPSIQDINQNTDIETRLEEVKKGRKVTELIFYSKLKEAVKVDSEKTTEETEKAIEKIENAEVLSSLLSFKIALKTANEIVKNHNQEYIKYVIKKCREVGTVTSINNEAGWIIKALESEFMQSEFLLIQAKSQEVKKEKLEKKEQDKKKKTDNEAKEEYKKYFADELERLDPEHLQELKNQFIEHLKNNGALAIVLRRVKEKGFTTAGVLTEAVDFLSENDIYIKKFDEFKKTL